MNKAIVALCGYPNSGKDTATALLLDSGVASSVNLGALARKMLNEEQHRLDPKSTINYSSLLRSRSGPTVMLGIAFSEINAALERSNLIIINSIKSTEEREYITYNFDAKVYTLALHANPHIRYERGIHRLREDDARDYETFKERDKIEKDWGLKQLMRNADFGVRNNGTVEDLTTKLTLVYSNILCSNS